MTTSSRVRITRSVRFSAAHRYHSEELTEAENREIFGKCNRPHGHGHDYKVDVSVEGPVDPVTGMVMNLADLDRVLNEKIVEPLDHSFLNLDVPHFAANVPTCENLVVYLAGELSEALRAGAMRLAAVRVWETEDLWAEIEFQEGES